MSTLHLGLRLGDVSGPQFQRLHLLEQLHSLTHCKHIRFGHKTVSSDDEDEALITAHQAGTTCIAVDSITSQYLVSGGADAAVRLWDLNAPNETNNRAVYAPIASLSRANATFHTHALTSISIYPHDPTPQTLITTSYDNSLILSSITPASLHPVHTFPLQHKVYTHAVHTLPTSHPLIATGTAHNAPRLLDLRSGLSTHALPGHSGPIYALSWHPTREHILISGSADSRIFAFDVRRATPAFASFDQDDTLGVITNPFLNPLNYRATAHSGAPVTGLTFTPDGRKLISAGGDQRIRVWDIASGRNELVHFGARVRNERHGNLAPLTVPAEIGARRYSAGGGNLVLWPNDDGKGEIWMYSVGEGETVRVLKTQGVRQDGSAGSVSQKGGGGRDAARQKSGKVSSGGRINGLAWRLPFQAERGAGLELYSAHGDGRVCAWKAGAGEDGDDQVEEPAENDEGVGGPDSEEERAQKSRKRKRALIENLVEGLSKSPVTFS